MITLPEFNKSWSPVKVFGYPLKESGVVTKLLCPLPSTVPGWKGNWYWLDDKTITLPSRFISSSVTVFISDCLDIPDSPFRIIVVGENWFELLLYAENLIDCPKLLYIILSPSYSFSLWIPVCAS